MDLNRLVPVRDRTGDKAEGKKGGCAITFSDVVFTLAERLGIGPGQLDIGLLGKNEFPARETAVKIRVLSSKEGRRMFDGDLKRIGDHGWSVALENGAEVACCFAETMRRDSSQRIWYYRSVLMAYIKEPKPTTQTDDDSAESDFPEDSAA